MTPTDFDWALRTEIYRTFADRGLAPSVAELATALGASEDQVREGLRSLAEAHQIATLAGEGKIRMAHPFSGIPTDYLVDTPQMECYANCAWDALGVPAILETDGWTRTHCAESGEPMEFGVRDGRLEPCDGVVHFVTPVRDAWVDIGFT